MSTDALLTPPRPGEGPRWRVAVARTAGQTAKITAADAIAQFRAAGCMATEIDVTRADPFIDHRTEWAGRGRPDAYDLVVVTGDLSPAVVALAVLADAPVVRLPIGSRPSLLGAIDSAVQADAVQTVPVAQVSIDGDRRFTRDAVHVPLTASRRSPSPPSMAPPRSPRSTGTAPSGPPKGPAGSSRSRSPTADRSTAARSNSATTT